MKKRQLKITLKIEDKETLGSCESIQYVFTDKDILDFSKKTQNFIDKENFVVLETILDTEENSLNLEEKHTKCTACGSKLHTDCTCFRNGCVNYD